MKKKIKILTVFGTRPEVIKLAPFIKAVEEDKDCLSISCATTQHRELQTEALHLFGVKPKYDLDIMRTDQDLSYVSSAILTKIGGVIEKEKPDFIVVQGDTTTAFISALAGFYNKIPIVHIEAGLRTGNLCSPFPEEANRSLISRIASLHMAPTPKARDNLLEEGISKNVFVVGNTIVDSIEWGLFNFEVKNKHLARIINLQAKKILITVHRRENFGQPLGDICDSVEELCSLYPTYKFIWPVHPNPNIKSIIFKRLSHIANMQLLEPLSYSDLLLLMNKCSLILSDSGGIQEEACILGKKIIVLRDTTERVEIIENGAGILAGHNREKIVSAFHKTIKNSPLLPRHNRSTSPYGAPGVSKNILSKLKDLYYECH